MAVYRRILIGWIIVLLSFQKLYGDWSTEWGGEVKTDIRYDVDRVSKPGFSRNENTLRLFLTITPNEHIIMRGDTKFIWVGFSNELTLEGLTKRADVDPWSIENDALYIDVLNIVKGLDIRIGRQIVQWGTADLFNPTDNINPDDLEDRLLFGENIANDMIKIDYSPKEDLIFTFVWVPLFKSAMLPNSASQALVDPKATPPFIEESLKEEIRNLQHSMCSREEIEAGRRDCILADPIVVRTPQLHSEPPSFSLSNSQIGAKVQFRLKEVDMSLSYYKGFDDIPVPVRSEAHFDPGPDGDTRTVVCDPEDPSEKSSCAHYVDTKVTLRYPRIHVFGFDLATQLSFLDNVGFWFEGAVFWPEEMKMLMTFPKAGGFPLYRDIEGTIVSRHPFFKFTTGFDYTINEYIFITAQFIRGFVDELGLEKLGYYVVCGSDIKLWDERILIRFFSVIELSKKHPSSLVFPMFQLNPWGSFELKIGAFVPIGSKESKFGQPATGPTTIFFQGSASF